MNRHPNIARTIGQGGTGAHTSERRRTMTAAKRARRGPTPLESAAAPPEGLDAGRPDLSTYSPERLVSWEVQMAHVTAMQFESWLTRLCAAEGVPMDSAGLAVLMLWVWVEAELVNRAMHPDEFAVANDAAEHGMSEADAVAGGLTIVRVRPAIMPRCQGHRVLGGHRCRNLRPHGERYCDACREAYWRTLGWTGVPASE